MQSLQHYDKDSYWVRCNTNGMHPVSCCLQVQQRNGKKWFSHGLLEFVSVWNPAQYSMALVLVLFIALLWNVVAFFCDSSVNVSVTHIIISVMLLLWNGQSLSLLTLCAKHGLLPTLHDLYLYCSAWFGSVDVIWSIPWSYWNYS